MTCAVICGEVADGPSCGRSPLVSAYKEPGGLRALHVVRHTILPLPGHLVPLSVIARLCRTGTPLALRLRGRDRRFIQVKSPLPTVTELRGRDHGGQPVGHRPPGPTDPGPLGESPRLGAGPRHTGRGTVPRVSLGRLSSRYSWGRRGSFPELSPRGGGHPAGIF